MGLTATQVLGLVALAAIAMRLGWVVQARSRRRQPLHGGALSLLFNYLSALCFVAILPTVLMTIFVLHPPAVEVAGILWSPLLLAVLTLALGSFGFALLHALVERRPRQGAQRGQAQRAARGWTEQDARSSGL